MNCLVGLDARRKHDSDAIEEHAQNVTIGNFSAQETSAFLRRGSLLYIQRFYLMNLASRVHTGQLHKSISEQLHLSRATEREISHA